MLDAQKIPCPIFFTLVTPPANSLEGMMNKYLLVNYTQDVFLYCDIDILITNTFSLVLEKMENNRIYACTEGKLKDHWYSDGFSNHVSKEDLEESLRGRPGFSAGKFAIVGKVQRDAFFKSINEFCDYSTNYATMEQPFFNMAIYLSDEETISVDYTLLTDYVSFNGEDYTKEKTIFFDNAGESAVASTHVVKTLYTLSLFLAGVL
jgi:lipopolysaccharide biosynthesis glycosyltransferase